MSIFRRAPKQEVVPHSPSGKQLVIEDYISQMLNQAAYFEDGERATVTISKSHTKRNRTETYSLSVEVEANNQSVTYRRRIS